MAADPIAFVEKASPEGFLIAALEQYGLDWEQRDRVVLALKLARAVVEEFSVHEKVLQ